MAYLDQADEIVQRLLEALWYDKVCQTGLRDYLLLAGRQMEPTAHLKPCSLVQVRPTQTGGGRIARSGAR